MIISFYESFFMKQPNERRKKKLNINLKKIKTSGASFIKRAQTRQW